jgi:hypothetical protein
MRVKAGEFTREAEFVASPAASACPRLKVTSFRFLQGLLLCVIADHKTVLRPNDIKARRSAFWFAWTGATLVWLKPFSRR